MFVSVYYSVKYYESLCDKQKYLASRFAWHCDLMKEAWVNLFSGNT